MRLVKSFLPTGKTLNIKLKRMITGGALPPSFVKAGPDQTIIQFANNPAFAPTGDDVGTRADAI